MKLHTALMIIGCASAVVAVKATDMLFVTPPNPRVLITGLDKEWVCITDMECQIEEDAKAADKRCLRINDEMVCLPIDRR